MKFSGYQMLRVKDKTRQNLGEPQWGVLPERGRQN